MIMKGEILPVFLMIALFTGGWFFSCESLNQQDLFGEKECDTSVVTYSGNILPILQNNCLDCHSAGSSLNFDGYDNFVVHVNSGRVHGAVNHRSGYLQMPRDRPKLPECELTLINKWIREGALNN